ncbi:MAG: AI-2E family transporter, partial [Proteobacteria bacterium]|nr:AI-2E family transporter [Pseudomonadota bacterium]
VLGLVAALIRSLAGLLSNVLFVTLMVGFMLFEAITLRSKVERALPTSSRFEGLAKTATEVNTYLLVKTGASSVTGLLAFAWTAAWGLDLPIMWGLLAFLLNYIPSIGSFVAAVPPVLLGVLQHGPGTALAVALGYVGINTAIGGMLEPRVLGHAMGLSPLVVLLSVLFWGWLLGPVGALLSVPLTMVVKIWLASSSELHWLAALLEGPPPKTKARLSPKTDPVSSRPPAAPLA